MTDEEYDHFAGIADVFSFGRVDDVKELLGDDRVRLDQELGAGETPFGVAVRFSNYTVVAYLIETCGTSVNLHFPNKRGEPPVKVAYDQRDTKMFEMLVAAGGDLEMPGWMGISVKDRMMGM